MLVKEILAVFLFAAHQSSTSATVDGDGTYESIEPTVQDGSQDEAAEQRIVHRRQAPWLFPQIPSFPSLVYYPGSYREGWRYLPPCRPYPEPMPPTYPSYQPPSTPSSSSDDPNEILDRMGGGSPRGKTPEKEEPTRCVWAVVACCSPGSRDIRYSCFELLGCPGAFWDVNPCDDKVVMAAANSALNFYSQKSNATSPTPS